MITLACGKDMVKLGIQTSEGINLSALLDHLERCPECRTTEATIIEALNQAIGGEKQD